MQWTLHIFCYYHMTKTNLEFLHSLQDLPYLFFIPGCGPGYFGRVLRQDKWQLLSWWLRAGRSLVVALPVTESRIELPGGETDGCHLNLREYKQIFLHLNLTTKVRHTTLAKIHMNATVPETDPDRKEGENYMSYSHLRLKIWAIANKS